MIIWPVTWASRQILDSSQVSWGKDDFRNGLLQLKGTNFGQIALITSHQINQSLYQAEWQNEIHGRNLIILKLTPIVFYSAWYSPWQTSSELKIKKILIWTF